MISKQHWLAIAVLLAGLGSVIGPLASWQLTTSPVFIGGVLTTIAAFIMALFSDKPQRPQ